MLRQAFRRLAQVTGFLFDQQQVARRIDDGKVDLAHQGVTLIDAGPVHAVVDGVGVGQACGEVRQGLDLALFRTCGWQRLPAFRDDVCHGGAGV